MDKTHDKEIDKYLSAIKDGDKNALSPLYDITSKKLYALCYSYFRNRENAEDALSDTYIKIVREINKFSGKSGFNWMYTIAKNICLNLIKKNSRILSVDFQDEQTVNMIDSINPQDTAEIDSGIVSIAKEILNENEFRIVMLHIIGGLKFGEIAKKINKIEATVRWQYNNAIKKLEKKCKEAGY